MRTGTDSPLQLALKNKIPVRGRKPVFHLDDTGFTCLVEKQNPRKGTETVNFDSIYKFLYNSG